MFGSVFILANCYITFFLRLLTYDQRLLREKDFIYAGKHEGWYSVSDETFYPDSGIAKTIDPQTGQLITVCGWPLHLENFG